MSFSQTATENLRCCSTATFGYAMQDESARQDRVEMERFWNLQHSKFVNHIGPKMVEVWDFNKLMEARTKMEVGKLRTKASQSLSRCRQTK